jgi:hypothetical protein
MGVSNCPECDTGVLVLDPASIPKWKLVCNKCDVIVRLFEDAAKVSVNSEESCPECDAQLVKVELSTFLSDLSVGLNVKNYFYASYILIRHTSPPPSRGPGSKTFLMEKDPDPYWTYCWGIF